MSEWNINIELLIHKYTNGTLTDSEAVYLAEWVKSSKQNATLFRNLIHAIESSKMEPGQSAEAFCKRFTNQEFRHSTARKPLVAHQTLRRSIYALFAAVAVVAVVVVATLVWNNSEVVENPTQLVAESSDNNQTNDTERVLEYTTPANSTLRVTLADGTEVTLNSNTRLTLAEDFNTSERNVTLDGEAYFDVAKSEKRFSVTAGNKRYIVHGTSFNILSFKGDKYAIVTLHSGKLEAKVDKQSYMLAPGEELRMDDKSKSISKHQVDTANSTSWINQELQFSRLPLKFVANQISHKYGIKINVHSDIEDIPYTGELRNEELETALHLISITSPIEVAITKSNNEYYISKKSN